MTEPSPLISASAEPRYQCQLQLIHAPLNTHQFLLSIVRSLSMSPHSVPSSRFRLVFLILAAVWCRELVFRQPCCVFILCLDSSLITTIHLLFIEVPVPLITIISLFVYATWLLNKVPKFTCNLLPPFYHDNRCISIN